ncbi:MAG: penicillin-binding protein 2 [Deltaproteobacteria bacterium]|nr:MAG: penicillin-binding protein 2 [Deltaproteobacteria bacterium]
MIPDGQGDDAVQTRTDIAEFDGRIRALVLLFFLVLGALGLRLWQLQIVEGEHYARLADSNFVRTMELAPERGTIRDARGRVVAENRPAWDVHLTPQIFRRAEEDALPLLARILNLGPEEVERLQARMAAAGRADILVRRDIHRDQLAELETLRLDLPGVYVRVQPRRYYPFHGTAAHVLGYMNEIQRGELDRLATAGYRRGDFIGRTGIERAWESVLRGHPGLQRDVVDVHGNSQPESFARQLLGERRHVPPIPGRDLELTIDMALQEIVEEAASGVVSAGIAVLDPRDGAVLAVYSQPGFNPNAWSGRLSVEEKRRSDNNPFHPMLDKAVQSWFPGSTYKVVAAIAAIEEGVVTEHDEVHCPGYLEYGNRIFRCWKRSGHGNVNLRRALSESCNVYFYQVGLRMGIDRMAAYAAELGFGERPGLGFNGESPGLVPTRAWHEENSPGGFQYGFILNTSVGQGDTRVSPMQLALAYAALANGGQLWYPRIVDRIVTGDGDVIFEYPARLRRQLPFDPGTLRAVNEGLHDVLHDSEGTAHDYRLRWTLAAGKTGTTQVRALHTARRDGDEVYFRDRDHAWYVAYAPYEDPQIVVAVFIEHGGQGSRAAAPVAMRIIDRYFREVRGLEREIEAVLNGGRPEQLEALLLSVSPERFPEALAGTAVPERGLRPPPPALRRPPANRVVIGLDD